MEAKKTPKKGSTFYSVNPETLSIKACGITLSHKHDCSTTTYENFTIDKIDNLSQIYSNSLPTVHKGIWYFETRDEAFDFVKSLIGM